MRSLLVIIDGLGDDHIPALNGLTPFQYGILTLQFDEDGNLQFQVTSADDDFLFDEIGHQRLAHYPFTGSVVHFR